MKTIIAHLKSASPYSQGRHYDVPKENNGKESFKDYEARTWRNRLHTDASGEVFIPPMAFKNCLAEAAKYLSLQIPGKGKSTYTKHFEAGVLVVDTIPLGIKAQDVKGSWVFVPADGQRGSGKRVDKCFPMIESWEAHVEFLVFDETVLDEYGKDDKGRKVTVFEHMLRESGKFIGIGLFRPRNNGYWGRFNVLSVKVG